jgi:hypothetical protein
MLRSSDTLLPLKCPAAIYFYMENFVFRFDIILWEKLVLPGQAFVSCTSSTPLLSRGFVADEQPLLYTDRYRWERRRYSPLVRSSRTLLLAFAIILCHSHQFESQPQLPDLSTTLAFWSLTHVSTEHLH